MLWLIIQFILSVVLLNKAADWFARSTASMALLTGMSRLWIGAIFAGFVTSIEEIVVSSMAAYTHHSEIAVGNSIGSVTFTCVIMGICLIQRQTVFEKAWFRDHGIPMLFSCLLLFLVFGLRDTITWPVALLLILFCVGYVAWSLVVAKRQPELVRRSDPLPIETLAVGMTRRNRWWVAGFLLAVSIPLIFISSWWFLHVAVQMAKQLGISESVIALSVVSIGTSLPELAAAMAGLRRGHYDTSWGVIFGSNIFIGVGALGVSGLFGPLTITAGNRLFDLPVMILVTFLPFLPLLVGRMPGRVMGYMLFVCYGLYLYSLFTVYGIFQP